MDTKGLNVIIKKRPDDPQEWNDAISSFPEGSFFQSTHWGDYLNFLEGHDTYYVLVKKNGETIGLSLLWAENIKLKNLPVLKRAFCFHGPLLKDYSNENVGIFLNTFNDICKKNRIVFMDKLSSPIHFGSVTSGNIYNDKTFFDGEGYSDRNWATIFVDLQKNEDDLWNNISYSAKKCLKKNQRERVEVSTIDEPKECKEYCSLLNIFLQNSGMKLPYFSFSMWDFLKNKEKCMEVFVAKQNGVILGGIGIIYFNGIVLEMAAWRSEHAIKNNIYVGDSLKWEVIKWARRNGFRLYDLSGISPNPSSAKEKGIRRFKEKWGGEVIVYPYCSKAYNRGVYCLYSAIKKMYNFVVPNE